MAIIELQLRQGPEAQRPLLTPLEGEMIYTTDTKRVYVGDGVTPGGNALRAPMPALGTADNSDHVASTRFVQSVIQNVTGIDLSSYARKTSPNVFTDDNTFNRFPTVVATPLPTSENSQRLATTQWVRSVLNSGGLNGNFAVRDQPNTFNSLNDFLVSPTVPTPPINDSSTKVATTAFVKNSMNAAGLGVSTVVISAATGTSVSYSAGEVTLPNGVTVQVSAGTLAFPANGTFYMIVDANGLVSQSASYPSGNDRRVVATVTTSSGAITAINLGSSDLSGYARLDGATFSGVVRNPTAASTTNDTTTANTAWVNSRLSSTGDPNLVRENTSNTYLGSTTQDFTASTILVPPLPITDDSNRAASTAFVKDVVDSLNIGGAGYALLSGATFTGPVSGPKPPANDNSTRFATTNWVNDETNEIRTLLDRILIGGDVFPTLSIRAGTRILDYTSGVVRLVNQPNACLISAENIELPANTTVWIYIDPTCGVNHYPFTSVLVKPPTGKAFAYATTNATTVTSVTLLQPETLLRGNVAIEGSLTIGGTLSSSVVIPSNAGVGSSGTSYPVANDDRYVPVDWVRTLAHTVSPVGSMMMWPFNVEPNDPSMILGELNTGVIWSICDGKVTANNWAIRVRYGMSNLPDFRDTFIRGANSSQGRAPYTAGGSNLTALTTANLPAHRHVMDHYHDILIGHIHNIDANAFNHAHLLGKKVRFGEGVGTGNQRYIVDVGMDQFVPGDETNDFTTFWNPAVGNPAPNNYVPTRAVNTAFAAAGNTVFASQTNAGYQHTQFEGAGAAFSTVPQHVNMHFIIRVN